MKKLISIILASLCLFSCLPSEEEKNTNSEFISLPKDFFPEGIASDNEGNLYVGSIKRGKINKIEAGQLSSNEFIKSNEGGLMSVIGMIIGKDGFLYACSSDPGYSDFTKTGDISLKKININTQKIVASYPLSGGGFCNDIAIDNENNIYVTDSFNPRILILKNNSEKLEEFITDERFKGEGFNLNGIAFDGDSSLYAVKYNDGKLFKINISSKAVEDIPLSRQLFTADGLKYIDGRLIVIEGADNSSRSLASAGLGKITEIILPSEDDDAIAKLKVLINGLDTPTTFTVVGEKIWVVESQYDHLFTHSDIKPDRFLIRHFAF